MVILRLRLQMVKDVFVIQENSGGIRIKKSPVGLAVTSFYALSLGIT